MEEYGQYEQRALSRGERRLRRLLADIHRVQERQYLKGDYSATIELVDLERAIERAELTERQAEALRLVYFEDLEQAEAGVRMGVSRATVTQYISNAIRKLAEAEKGI